MNDRFVILSGCSGGGKSTLLEALRRRGHAVVDEPGRRIVRHELATGGTSLPWLNMEAFARRAIEVSLADLGMASVNEGWVFFDRGLVDAAAALEHVTSEPTIARLCQEYRYHVDVFFVPPWPELFGIDTERQLRLDDAIAEYERLERAYRMLGYRVTVLPHTNVEARADLVLDTLRRAGG
jgi:predicted ATPase